MEHTARHIDRIALEFTGLHLPILLLLIAAACAFSLWYYRETVPPVRGWKRGALVTLRAAACILLLVCLAEPVLNMVATVTRQSRVAVLLDTSSSMANEGDSARMSEALEALGTIRSHLGDAGEYLAFDSGFRSLEEGEPRFTGSGTDILAGLEKAHSGREVSSMILISDGRWNLGEDPAAAALLDDIPVSTVTVGSAESETDVIISRISAAPVGRDGETLPVEVVISSTRVFPNPVTVSLHEDGRMLASGTVSFRTATQTHFAFALPLQGAGDHTYNVKIDPPGDIWTENNERLFRVHVLKSSFHILLAAAKPSADLAFLRRAIESDDSFDLQVVVDAGVAEKIRGQFPDDFSGYDALILLHWGGTALTPKNAQNIDRWVSGGGGIWLLGDSSPHDPGPSMLSRVFPVTFPDRTVRSPGQFTILRTVTGEAHFITAGEGRGVVDWHLLPPISAVMAIPEVTPEGSVLAQASTTDAGEMVVPAIISGKHGLGKTLVMPLSGIWRWHLMMEGAGKGGTFYRDFVIRAVNWLTSETETSPLTVATDQGTYLSGQEVQFEARLYDDIYSPVSGAEISLVIDGEPSSKIILQETKPAVYTEALRRMGEGDHVFTAVAYQSGIRTAETTGTFSVQRFSLEMLDVTPNPAVMGAIAAMTGGISVTSAGVDSILTLFPPVFENERTEEKYSLYLSLVMPMGMILFLTIEWALRKQRGML